MQMQANKMKVIISGGGTGGHIFPAIAIANALKKRVPGINILFVGAKGRMEMEKVPDAGYPIEGLTISGIQRSLSLKNLSFPFKVLAALRHAKRIVKDFKPDAVVGVGGYASGPVLRVASGMHIPAVIQEQNSYPGVTNKLLAAKAAKICVAYEGMEKFFPKEKIILTGNPVRQDILDLAGKRQKGVEEFGIDAAKKVVLIIGGSLGARTINESIHQGLGIFAEKNVQLIWQTGKSYAELAKDAVAPFAEKGIRTFAFISRMDIAYAVADLVVSRAGAISISELCLVKKPAILIPSPNVAEDHQTHNAMALVRNEAALMVKDIESREKLLQVLFELLENETLCAKLSENIGVLGKASAADDIAGVVLNLMENKK
jgi:UDP-N-acetylglucosamine--N-acetylmuramyl-(pentapeptide) pyrophosphoryl-undecaprenol N-acetylglucosamine transferase